MEENHTGAQRQNGKITMKSRFEEHLTMPLFFQLLNGTYDRVAYGHTGGDSHEWKSVQTHRTQGPGPALQLQPHSLLCRSRQAFPMGFWA